MPTESVAAAGPAGFLQRFKGGLWFRVSRGFSYSMFATLATNVLAFVLAPIYTRHLSPEDYGTVSLANSIRSVLLMLMPMSLGSGISYWYNLHRNAEGPRQHALGLISGMVLVSSTVWLLIGLATGHWLQTRLLPDFPLAFWPYGALVVFTAWLMCLQTFPLGVLATTERQDITARLDILTSGLQLGTVILMVVGLHRGAGGQVEAMGLSSLAVAGLYVWFMLRQARPHLEWKLGREVLAYSLPLLPHQMAVWGLNLSDRVIIGSYGAQFARELGFYSFAYAVAMLMRIVVVGFNSIWVPVYMEQARHNERARQVLGGIASWAFLGFALVACGVILFSTPIVTLLGSEAYRESDRYVMPIVLGFLVQGFYQFPSMALFHSGKTGRVPVITIVAVTVNIGLNILLIPKYGPIVAAWTTFIGYALQSALGLALGHRVFPLQYQWKPLAFSVLVVAVALGLNTAPHAAASWLAIKAAVWLVLAVTCVACWLKWGDVHAAASPVSPHS